MKVTIDEKKCIKNKLTFSEFLLALAFRERKENDIHNMLNRGILTRQSGQYIVSEEWSKTLDKILQEAPKECTKTDEELLELAKGMSALYPKGKVPGTAHLYRTNPKEVVSQLKKFFAYYGDYSNEEILDATRRYVASFRGNYQFLKTLKYFISKNEDEMDEDGNTHKVKHSFLADFLENKEDEDTAAMEDWQRYNRN